MSNIIKLHECGGCGKFVHPHQVICELNGHFHASCWNEIVDDLEKVGNECDNIWDEHIDHYIQDMADYYHKTAGLDPESANLFPFFKGVDWPWLERGFQCVR